MTRDETKGANATEPAVVVRGLRVDFPGLDHPAVDGIDFDLKAGQCLALVGESGSGKSVTARALMGLTGARVQAQTLRVLGHECAAGGRVAGSEKHWLKVRRSGVAVITQDALAGLDPLRKVGAELSDADRCGLRGSSRQEPSACDLTPSQRIHQALAQVGLTDGERILRQRPHQLSGGMRQRALVAAALLCQPRLLIADEATTALDARLTNLVLDQVAAARDRGVAVLLISHDLAQVAQVADRILVMRQGTVVESGTCASVLGQPRSEYTSTLLASIPAGVPRGVPLLAGARPDGGTHSVRPESAAQLADQPAVTQLLKPPPVEEPGEAPVLETRNLVKRYGNVAAVDGVSLTLQRGKTLGLVGESGCGKTTTARLVLGLETPDAGQVRVVGKQFAPLPWSQSRALRHHLGAIYQNPLGSFDPRYRCGQILTLAATAGRSRQWRKREDEIMRTLRDVGLSEDVAERYPHELSGGQRQRLAIARALVRHPQVLVFDEPVSALDVTIQARVLDLLDEVQARTGAGFLFISHDLDVVEHVSDEVAFMQAGRIVEVGATSSVFNNPTHAYSRELLSQRLRLR
ncbi:MAG: ABC transporter ATP-binding protein [Actinomycetaceae bacterium]|nr:ABC transporter ATP-binding protein [Actinomycetaceae bacterium]